MLAVAELFFILKISLESKVCEVLKLFGWGLGDRRD